jgi:hypothetical protein
VTPKPSACERLRPVKRAFRLATLAFELSVGDDERGQSLSIDWDSYRRLASTALAIIGQNRPTMGL